MPRGDAREKDLGMKREYQPMLLTPIAKPFDSPEWEAEKWDGYRAITRFDRRSTTLTSRNGTNLTPMFPELSALHREIRQTIVLDGEIVKIDDRGLPMFDAMRRRSIPATLVAFDVLQIGNRVLLDVPLVERQRILATVVPEHGAAIIRSVPIVGKAVWLYQKMCGLKIEGIVMKRLQSPYICGARSADWLKVHTPWGRAVIAQRGEHFRRMR